MAELPSSCVFRLQFVVIHSQVTAVLYGFGRPQFLGMTNPSSQLLSFCFEFMSLMTPKVIKKRQETVLQGFSCGLSGGKPAMDISQLDRIFQAHCCSPVVC